MQRRFWRISEAAPLQVLVLGGTGHIGAAISRAFAEAGHHVTASGRTVRPRPNLDDTAVRIVHGDDRDPDTIEGWIGGKDLVVDAAAPYPLQLHDRKRAETIAAARRRTAQILTQVRNVGAAVIYVSSFTTLPHRRSPLGQVRQGIIEGLHSYFDLKAQIEADVESALAQGLRGAILNPATCFGPYDLKPKAQTFIPMLLEGAIKGLAKAPFNVVDVRDVGTIACAAAMAGFPDRRVPIFGHNTQLTEFAGRICAQAGQRPPAVEVPPVLGLAALYWTETAFAATGRPSPWHSLPMMLLDASYPAVPSAEQLRLHAQLHPLEQTLRDAITWYTDTGYL